MKSSKKPFNFKGSKKIVNCTPINDSKVKKKIQNYWKIYYAWIGFISIAATRKILGVYIWWSHLFKNNIFPFRKWCELHMFLFSSNGSSISPCASAITNCLFKPFLFTEVMLLKHSSVCWNTPFVALFFKRYVFFYLFFFPRCVWISLHLGKRIRLIFLRLWG